MWKIGKRRLKRIDKGFVDGRAIWTVTDFEDSAWKINESAGLMQEQGLKGFKWYRLVQKNNRYSGEMGGQRTDVECRSN